MGIRRKSQFSWWCQSVEDSCEAYLSSLLWRLDTCSKQVSMSQMLVWKAKEHFYKKNSVCLTRSLNFLKVPGWVKSPLILCSNLHLSPCQKVSPKESEIKCSSRQLMAFMTQIEICIWNHKIMQNQEPNLRSIGKIAWGNKKLNNRVENTFPFTWSGGSSGTF